MSVFLYLGMLSLYHRNVTGQRRAGRCPDVMSSST